MPVAGAGPDPVRTTARRAAMQIVLSALLLLALLLPGLLVGGLARLAWDLLAGTLAPGTGDAGTAGLLLFSVVPGLLHGLAAGWLAAFLAGRMWQGARHVEATGIVAAVVVVLGGLAGTSGALDEVFSFGVPDVTAAITGLVGGLLLGARRSGVAPGPGR